MDWSWAASSQNRGQRCPRFPKRRAPRPKLMRLRRLPDEKPTSEREGAGGLEAEAWILSSWTLAHFCCEQVRTMVRGAWSQRRIQECQPALQRYVRSRKRKRGHRETEQRALVQRRCPQPAEAGGA